MTTYNTRNKVGSAAAKDLFDNSENFDRAINDRESEVWVDRLGVERISLFGVEKVNERLIEKFNGDMSAAIIAAGYITVDSFQQGADLPNNEITLRNHILRDETTGEYYRWDGDLPKSVPAGSTPQSTGGIAKGAWVSVGDASLRGDLVGEYGAGIVGGAIYRISSVNEMKNLRFTPKNGDICITSGYYNISDGGGAEYVYSTSITEPEDGFIIHDFTSGGKWKLVDNRSRLPFQVAGAKVDGVADDTTALISALRAKRPMSLSRGIMRIFAAINLDEYIDTQFLGLDISGLGRESIIEFNDGSGGFYSKNVFFRSCNFSGIHIRNGAKDKNGCGFRNPRGAEQVNWENVTFSYWKVSHDVHAWNSSLKTVTSVNCEYAGCYSGTSMDNGSFYAIGCDFGHQLGFRYNPDTNTVDVSPQPLSYSTFSSNAADDCGSSYSVGACRNVVVEGSGAEIPSGECVIDLSRIPTARSGQLITFKSFDIYIQSSDTSIIEIVKEPSYEYGCYRSVVFEDSTFYSDLNIPAFSNNGKGIVFNDCRYNSTGIKRLTRNDTDGMIIDGIVINYDGKLKKTGFTVAGFDQLRNVKSLLSLNPVSGTASVVLRLQDTSVPGLAQGVTAFGRISFYPVNKSAGNASRSCGDIVFSLAADWEAGLDSINAQKLGNTSAITVARRNQGGVQEIVFTLPTSVIYMCTLDYWCNGKFDVDFRDYYTL
ncbi:hypothetical protein [Providencia sp.]|uniref:tail fiber/spike domain-containing protein n=1 Tax=Providencia sp. TaxID=589 RepID=UPI003F9E0CFB